MLFRQNNKINFHGFGEGIMILRGYTKNLIVVKNLENPLIDEAFLILKKEAREEATEEDIVREANMLISGFDIRTKKKAPLGGAVWFLLGALASGFALSLLFICLNIL